MRQIYGLLVWTVLLGLSLTFNRAQAQYGPGQPQQNDPASEGLRYTLNTLRLPGSFNKNTAARPTEIVSRYIGKTIGLFNGSAFIPVQDSLNIRWHGTAGVGYIDPDFFTGNYNFGYFVGSFIGYDTIGPRGYQELNTFSFDTLRYFPAMGAGYSATPRYLQAHSFGNSGNADSMIAYDNGQKNQRREYFYDAAGNRVATKVFMISTPNLVLDYIDSLSYDSNGNLSSYKWINVQGAILKPIYMDHFEYNSNNQIVLEDRFSYNGNVPVPTAKWVFSYNAGHKRTAMTYWAVDTATGTFVNLGWTGSTYDNNNRQLSRSNAHIVGGVWDTTEKVTYEYGVQDMPEVAYVMRDTATSFSLDTMMKIRYYFTPQDQCDSAIIYSYPGAGQWTPQQKTSFQRNDFGQITFIDAKRSFNSATGVWSYAYYDFQAHYYYELFDTRATGIKDTKSSLVFSMYPNPVTGGTLHLSAATEPIKLISVYDLAGRLLVQQQVEAGKREVVFSLGQLPAGTYILNIRGDKGSGSKKIIVR